MMQAAFPQSPAHHDNCPQEVAARKQLTRPWPNQALEACYACSIVLGLLLHKQADKLKIM